MNKSSIKEAKKFLAELARKNPEVQVEMIRILHESDSTLDCLNALHYLILQGKTLHQEMIAALFTALRRQVFQQVQIKIFELLFTLVEQYDDLALRQNIIDLLYDESYRGRRYLIQYLYDFRRKELIPHVEYLLEDNDETIQASISSLLYSFGSPYLRWLHNEWYLRKKKP